MARARRLVALGLVALAACGPTEPDVPAEPADPVDVVLIVIDTWRWDDLGANGAHERDVTSRLDRFAERGVRFERAITQSPWTLPSVATLLTGRYPTIHGAYGRYKDVRAIRRSIPTLAELFRASGYRTAALVNAPFLGPKFELDRGFEVYDHHPSRNDRLRRAGPTVNQAIRVLEAPRDAPLFLLVHLFDPHMDYDPSKKTRGRFTAGYQGPIAAPFRDLRALRSGEFDPADADRDFLRALYQEEVAAVDQALQRLFDALAASEQDEVVVVTADHGEEFGDHGGWEHGHTVYWEQVRVPLIVVPPPSIEPARSVIGAQVRTLDIAPSLLEAAGRPIPDAWPGRSFWPWITGDEEPAPRVALSEHVHLGRPAAALRDGRHTLVRYLADETSELYDASSDPYESNDVAAREPGIVAELEERLAELTEALQTRARAMDDGSGELELDPELEERLRSLGYLGR